MLSDVYKLYKLMKNQWLPRKQLVALQNKKLRAIISHAYHHKPFSYCTTCGDPCSGSICNACQLEESLCLGQH